MTFKVFNENSHIVAIRCTGNVFAYEVRTCSLPLTVCLTLHLSVLLQAVERLNLKPRHLRDLLSDEPFTRSDIITLQDPMAPEKFDVSSFYHVKNKISLREGLVSYRAV